MNLRQQAQGNAIIQFVRVIRGNFIGNPGFRANAAGRDLTRNIMVVRIENRYDCVYHLAGGAVFVLLPLPEAEHSAVLRILYAFHVGFAIFLIGIVLLQLLHNL